MKPIDNYINERLNPRHLGSAHEFPINSTPEEMIEFLNEHGFENIHVPSLLDYSHASYLDKGKDKCYSITYYDTNAYASIYFTDTKREKISEENPMYQIYFTQNKAYLVSKYTSKVTGSIKMNFKEFTSETKKYFK